MTRLLRSGREVTLPVAVLVLAVVLMIVAPQANGLSVSEANINNVFRALAVSGLTVIGLAATMICAEFDLSVPGSFLLGTVLAVKFGAGSPLLGVVLAVAGGLAVGLVQGWAVGYLRISSIVVTLGGLLTLIGLCYVLTNSQTLSYANYNVGIELDNPIAGIFSARILIVIAVIALAGVVLHRTRVGVHMRATGSDRRAARAAGISPPQTLLWVFGFSGAVCALGGALTGYSLAAAQPTQSVSALQFAATAALLGGVGLKGGTGKIVGIVSGILALIILDETMSIMGWTSNLVSVVSGLLLAIVALAGAPGARNLVVYLLRERRSKPPASLESSVVLDARSPESVSS